MDNNNFKYESIFDKEALVELLENLTEGVKSGQLELSDQNKSIQLSPQGLMQFRVTAGQEGSQHKLSLRVSWQGAEQKAGDGVLKVKAGNEK